MIYLDTSAAAKLVHDEDETPELSLFLTERAGNPLFSSALLLPELLRAVSRHDVGLTPRAHTVLQRIMRVPLAHEILSEAATIGGPSLRTLDAIHLATAAGFTERLTAFITYDKRLAAAAAAVGLPVAAPA